MKEFSRRHGHIGGGRVCIVGMGKLGSRELTAGSDVDLILLYDHDPDVEHSDGEKALDTPALFRPPDAAPDRRRLGTNRRRHTLRTRSEACGRPATRDRWRLISRRSANTSVNRPGPGSTWR